MQRSVDGDLRPAPAPDAGHCPALQVRPLGLCDYTPVWHEMQAYTRARSASSDDQLWLLQHRPVYTLGMNGKREHLLHPQQTPVVDSDRGGQVTYHGPGQLVAYVLLDLRRLSIGVRTLVSALELSVVDWLRSCGIEANTRADAPGVYVDGAKIAALGLRVRGGCSYHGLALNVDMDLAPFAGINPCGYPRLPVTQVKDLGVSLPVDQVGRQWATYFAARFDYSLRWQDAPGQTGK